MCDRIKYKLKFNKKNNITYNKKYGEYKNMNFNMELWKKCQKCSYLQRKPYLENNKIIYTYVCNFGISVGMINCNNYIPKDELKID